MEKPPFTARNKQEREAMVKWVHALLRQYDTEFYYDDVLSRAAEECRKRGLPDLVLPGAIEAALQGDVSPLRRYVAKKVHPEVAEFIQPLKLKKGSRPPKRAKWAAVRETAKLVRGIWWSYYRKRRRRSDDGPSAEDIAAAYHGVHVADVTWSPGGKKEHSDTKPKPAGTRQPKEKSPKHVRSSRK